MEITDALVDRLAFLSRLKFSEEEKPEIKADMQKMLNFIDALDDVNTDGVAPLIHMSNEVNVLRPDVEGDMLKQSEALKNAPKKDDYYFRVPKVLKK